MLAKLKVLEYKPTAKATGYMCHLLTQFNERLACFINNDVYPDTYERYNPGSIAVLDVVPSRGSDGLQLTVKMPLDIQDEMF